MLFQTTRLHLMSIPPAPFCSPRSALRVLARGRGIPVTNLLSRAAATGSPRQLLPVPKPDVTNKPLSGVIQRSVAPRASDVRDDRLRLLANNLARDGKRTLFRAESHVGNMCAAWMGGILCLAGALTFLNEKVHEASKELPWFVPAAFRISAIFLVGMAGFAITRSARLISSIEILPGNDKARLVLNVRRNIPLPLIKPKKLIVLASDVTLQRKVVTPMGEQVQTTSRLENSRKSFILEVARSISAALSRFFVGVRQFIFMDGIIWVSLKGRGGSWKLDSYGRFPEDGDRLMKLVKMEG